MITIIGLPRYVTFLSNQGAKSSILSRGQINTRFLNILFITPFNDEIIILQRLSYEDILTKFPCHTMREPGLDYHEKAGKIGTTSTTMAMKYYHCFCFSTLKTGVTSRYNFSTILARKTKKSGPGCSKAG